MYTSLTLVLGFFRMNPRYQPAVTKSTGDSFCNVMSVATEFNCQPPRRRVGPPRSVPRSPTDMSGKASLNPPRLPPGRSLNSPVRWMKASST